MKLAHLNVYFFFLVLIGVAWMTFLLFQPFLTAILAAAILAALFQRPYQFLLEKFGGRSGWSAFCALLLVAAVIIIPLFVILGIATNEADNLFRYVGSENTSSEALLQKGLDTAKSIPYAETIFGNEAFSSQQVINGVKNFSGSLLGFAQTLYESVAHFVAWIFIMFFTLFYFFADGKGALAYIMKLSPLRDEHERLLIRKFVSISRATLKGTLMVGIVQGFLGGLLFAIVGIPSPVLWGIFMTVLSIIPAVGAGIVWLPAGIILLVMGQVWQGVTVLVVGAGLISTIDNILRPKLVGRDTEMHPLIVFFATLGGIALFGFPGFIIGPIIVSLFLALWEIYAIEFKGQLQAYNE